MTLADQVREALRDHPTSRYRISKQTGLSESLLSRFLRGGWLTEPHLNTLAAHLGIAIVNRR